MSAAVGTSGCRGAANRRRSSAQRCCGWLAAAGTIKHRKKIFSADGADWCWEVQATFFADAVPIVDWYHVSEHVWTAARAVAAPDAKTRAREALTQLADGGGAALVTWLLTQQKARRGRTREALDDLLKYLRPRVERMNYPAYRAHGWQIGTGLIESTCNLLVGQRLKGPGMHWTEAGALALTALRATDFNGEWKSTWNNLILST